MESMVQELIKVSPFVACLVWLLVTQNNKYSKLVDSIQENNKAREEKYQDTIKELTQVLQVTDTIREDVKEIKNLVIRRE